MFKKFDSAPESNKKSISRSGVCNCWILDFLKEVGLSLFFPFVPVVL